jgi:LysM repeat protein
MTFQVVGIGIITLAMVLMFQSLQSLSSISTSAQAKSDKEVQILVNFNQSVGVGQVSKSQLAEISFVDPAELEKQKVEEEAKKQPKYYVVSQGDSLYSISQKYKVDLTQLAESNNIEKPYNLVVGQKIIIPAQT